MLAIGYIRMSSEEQSREDVSLAAHRRQIRAFCTARRWSLVEVFSDEGISAKSMENRPGLQAALAALDRGTAQGKAMIGFLAVLAQMEREQTGERTRIALVHIKSTGRYLGHVPFGRMQDEEGRLVEDREAISALRRAKRLRAQGKTRAEVAETMG